MAPALQRRSPVGHRENRAVSKASGHRAAAVDAGHGAILGVAAQLEPFNHGGKSLLSSICTISIGHHRGGKYTVGIAGFYGIRQLVVNSTAPGMLSNSFCWFCQAVPKLPFRWGYF